MEKKAFASLLILPVIWGCYYVASNLAVAEMSVFSVGIVIRLVTLLLLTVIMGVRGQLSQLLRVRFVWKKLLLIGLLGFLLDTTAFLGIDFGSVEIGGLGNLFFIASALFVSINAFVIKSAQHDAKNPVSDNVVAYYNNLVTLLLFTAAAAVKGDLEQLALMRGNAGLTGALLAASLGQTLIYLFYYYDLRRFPVWIVKVFLLLVPVVTALISYFLFGEELGWLQLAGMAVVLGCAGGIVAGQRENKQRDGAQVTENREEKTL